MLYSCVYLFMSQLFWAWATLLEHCSSIKMTRSTGPVGGHRELTLTFCHRPCWLSFKCCWPRAGTRSCMLACGPAALPQQYISSALCFLAILSCSICSWRYCWATLKRPETLEGRNRYLRLSTLLCRNHQGKLWTSHWTSFWVICRYMLRPKFWCGMSRWWIKSIHWVKQK